MNQVYSEKSITAKVNARHFYLLKIFSEKGNRRYVPIFEIYLIYA